MVFNVEQSIAKNSEHPRLLADSKSQYLHAGCYEQNDLSFSATESHAAQARIQDFFTEDRILTRFTASTLTAAYSRQSSTFLLSFELPHNSKSVMESQAWLGFANANGEDLLWVQEGAFSRTVPDSDATNACPSIITVLGRRRKAALLSCMLDLDSADQAEHGQVRLISDPKVRAGEASVVYVDCELQIGCTRPRTASLSGCVQIPIEWLRSEPSLFFNAFISNVLSPLSNIVCYMASDFGGIRGVADLLAHQATRPVPHTLPRRARAHVLVVMDTSARIFDTTIEQEKFHDKVRKEMIKYKTYSSFVATEDDLCASFHSIQVLGLQRSWGDVRSADVLQRRLSSLSRDIRWNRRTSRYLFNTAHVDAFSHLILHKFCKDRSAFNFVRASRPQNFVYRDLQIHISELLKLIPNHSHLWSFVCPLTASCLFLTNYPPGSHNFPPSEIFREYYANRCTQAVQQYSGDLQAQRKFISKIQEHMEDMLRKLEADASLSASRQHMEHLSSFHGYFRFLKSSRTCFCCLHMMPEKTFSCGHAVCNICIQRFGQRPRTERHAYTLSACLLCGEAQVSTFYLTPPTAGIRILCIDGGGVRGVVPLTFLKHLEDQLGYLGRPLGDFFDYVCGTSAGGLIAIGLFLMQWSTEECLERFEDLAIETFMIKKQEKMSIAQRIQQLLGAYVRDHQYDSQTIENAFRTPMGTTLKMFNPLQNDAKVAVTATTARGNIPCIFTNYNGGPRPDDSIYHHIRADTYTHDVSICDAAVSTSAAPFFFKPRDVNNIDTFQDGGLQHNNPVFVASWESAFLWPDRCQILESDNGRVDHMISLGTGTTSTKKYRVGPHSPVKDRFLKRLVGSFMGQLDSEKQWRTFIHCIPPRLRSRYHRLNVLFSGPEPALDEVRAIKRLKEEAAEFITTDATAALAKDTMIASIFYFELESWSHLDRDAYFCCGTIRCRLPLEYPARKRLYHTLIGKNAFFLVAGNPTVCVRAVPKGVPAFRCRVTFTIVGMDTEINISIKGMTSEITPISGMPRPLRQLIQAQNLIAPFGCADNRVIEKSLPALPVKRKFGGS